MVVKYGTKDNLINNQNAARKIDLSQHACNC